ncbi:hypothetical protein D3C78_1924190 [compost metagenome]
MQRAVGGAAGEGLVALDAPAGERIDGLEQAVEQVVGEDSLQFAQLFGGRHAGLGRQ